MTRKKSVAIFGAGIAGLTAAHEFSKRGYSVNVYELNPEAGGFFRSLRVKKNIPSEYSWHGMGPWYNNVFELLKEIPFDERGSLYDYGLTRPIDFGLAPDEGSAEFDDPSKKTVNVKAMFRMTALDLILWFYVIARGWCSDERTFKKYSQQRARTIWKPFLSKKAFTSWCACFGPWIGSDHCHVSYHTTAHFFRRQLFNDKKHYHKADSRSG